MSDSSYRSDDVSHNTTTTDGHTNTASGRANPQQITSSLHRMTKLVTNLLARSDSLPFREPVDWRSLELYDYPKIIKKMMDLGTVKRKLEKGKYNDAYECAEDIRLVWKNCQTYNADGSDFYLLASTFSKRFEERFQKIVDDFGEDVVYASNAMPSSASGGGGGAAMASARHSSHPSSLGGRNARSNSTTGSSGRTTPVPNAVDNSAHPSSGSKSDNKGNNTHTNVGGAQSCSSLSGNSKEIITLDIRTRFAARLQRLSGMELGHVLQVLDMRCPDALDDPTEESLPSGAPRVTKQHNYSWETFDGGCQLEIDVDVIPPDVFYELDKYVKDKVQGRGRGAWSDEVWTESYNNNVGGAEGAGGGTRGSIKGKKRKHKSM